MRLQILLCYDMRDSYLVSGVAELKLVYAEMKAQNFAKAE